MVSKKMEENWSTVIRSQNAWFNINFSEIWHCQDLIYFFVRRDFVSIYKQTVLGPLWFVLQPLVATLVFTVVFGKIAGIPTDGVPQVLFYMCGIVMWNYFSDCFTKTSNTFITNAPIFGKVYFPRLVIPISIVITNILTFAIQFVTFLGFMCYFYLKGFAIKPNLWVLLTPLLLLQMVGLGLGFGMLVSSLTTKYKDLRFVVQFGIQLWMYATPIVYPLSQVPAKWQFIYALNPMAIIIETFRYSFFGSGVVRLWQLGLSFAITLFVLFVGILLFSRIEKTFMDTV